MYKMNRSLTTHMKYDCGGQTNFVCHICSISYRKKARIDSSTGCSRTIMEGFTCHQCGRSYQLRHNLVKHLRFECGGQKHFLCYLCPARYTQNGKLRQHMLNAHNVFIPPRRTWIRSS
ncbi:gastrula zinc finger protein XlCGF57.1-like [Apis florea]|uniref:gastrula zinc finger protein XlCGF57.1-like n=1 Tax=Apis florea TaxID=7463 RepID=UPI0012FEA577|nr:gastrula zinc finger protein XlCGF57.1-like [Apis florea]